MDSTTIAQPGAALYRDIIQGDVLSCLKRQPGMPVSVDELAASLAGVLTDEVETALREIEGPASGPGGYNNAYVHVCRCSDLAVYIP